MYTLTAGPVRYKWSVFKSYLIFSRPPGMTTSNALSTRSSRIAAKTAAIDPAHDVPEKKKPADEAKEEGKKQSKDQEQAGDEKKGDEKKKEPGKARKAAFKKPAADSSQAAAATLRKFFGRK